MSGVEKNTASAVAQPVGSSDVSPDHVFDPLAAIAIEATSGDKEGTRRFLQHILPIARRIARSVLGKGHPDLEDAVQESLLSALKGLGQFRFEGPVTHYVAKIAFRETLVIQRRRANRWKKQQSLESHHESSISAPERHWSSEDIEVIKKLLDNLPAVQSDALFMQIVLELSVDEIARSTNVSSETVRTRLRRGKNALRKQLVVPFWKRWLSGEAP